MFYVGSTSVSKIKNGYRGSVASKAYKEIWITELKNNPQLFETKIISFHSKREEAIQKENLFHKKLGVVLNDLYINRANAILDGCFGSDNKGVNNPMFGTVREDAKIRLLTNNPMKNSKIAAKVSHKKKELRSSGLHKSTKNSRNTLILTSERMRDNNPSKIKCSCVVCRKETTFSAIIRFHKHDERK
jgi:hypothetical protein